MAKQQQKQSQLQPKKKEQTPSGGGSFTYLLRNFITVVVVGFILLAIYDTGEKQGELSKLSQEFSQMRQSGASRDQLQQLYNQIMALQMEIQSDTGYFKRLTRSYYWAVHELAMSSVTDIEDRESKAGRPITREEKIAQRVGIYPLIDYINKNTPSDAVIYLPEGDSAMSNNNKWNYVYDPEWMEYFLYPRLCVAQGREKDHPDLAKRVTHIVIVDGKGYNKLKYEVPMEQRKGEAVLPIEHPPTQTPK